ncbi:protein-export chaperone SecB [Tenacibaculum mesophilum]|uniref:protein-export chaperone SecB n=1 Tax=Tenacibaculum mesophilum TaxID=104268 RepID=UPI00064A7E53|nr:protein-export chaperone SecB [Tenacibaculum mesophilum]
MNKAAFSLENYKFDKINIDYSNYSKDISINFEPYGKYSIEKGVFYLKVEFIASEEEKDFVRIECLAEFEFEQALDYKDIPNYFYTNCIAIIFPYIRSFVSTVTLQANIKPIILPTLNLSDLAEPLKKRTTQI